MERVMKLQNGERRRPALLKKLPFPSMHLFYSRLHDLVFHPVFAGLTLVGNFAIFGSAFAIYFLEFGTHPQLDSFLDALWWSVSTVTTVGYGDIVPLTPAGRIIGMCLMMGGTVLFWAFTALFAAILLSPEVTELEDDVNRVGDEVQRLKTEVHHEDQRLDVVISHLEKTLRELRRVKTQER